MAGDGILESTIVTKVAREEYDDHRYRGYSLFHELLGSETIASLLGLAISGRRLGPDETKMLDDLAVAVCVADPHIWLLKPTRIVAALGNTLPALAVGAVCMEDATLGPWTSVAAARLFVELSAIVERRRLDVAAVDAALDRIASNQSNKRVLPGFGVPLRETDERVVALRARVRSNGREHCPYWKLFERTATLLENERGLRPNIASAFAAVGLDLGFDPKQIGSLGASVALLGCFLPNAVEEAELQSATLRKIPRRFVRYRGQPPRVSPRHQGA